MHLARGLFAAVVLSAFLCRSGEAQDEARLRKALEGKRITLKMDMPATSDGVDVFPGSNRPIDYEKVGKRTKSDGVAIKDGESARITRVKVKDELIEIQLNGGGYGTFGDALNSWGNNTAADSGTAQQLKYQNERTQKLAAGSRFNLRYPNGVDPDDLTGSAIAQALEEYATLPAELVSATVHQASLAAAPAVTTSAAPANPDQVRKGMSAGEVAGILGTPTSNTVSGPMTTNRYRGSNGMVEVDFVNDVAVAVRQMPSASGGALRKGLSEAEVEQLAGKPTSSAPNGQMVTKKYNWQEGVLEADFFNGVLVAYRTSSK